MASLLQQGLTPNSKISAQLHVIEAHERYEKSPRKGTSCQARCCFLGVIPHISTRRYLSRYYVVLKYLDVAESVG